MPNTNQFWTFVDGVHRYEAASSVAASVPSFPAPTPLRVCNQCGTTLQENRENFYQRPNGSWCAHCRPCNRRIERERRTRRGSRRPGRQVANVRFGVEIEFIGADRSTLAREMQNRGLRVAAESYNHHVRNHWKIVPDGSIVGWELVSPPLRGEDGYEQVRQACAALAAAGARVDRTCGLHVHHDMRGFTARAIGRAFRNWFSCQPAIDGLVSPRRRNSRWAAPLTEGEVQYIEQLRSTNSLEVRRHFSYGVDRYRSLNVACYPRFGTVEIRQHQGSINARKILAWVEFGQAFFAAARASVDLNFLRPMDLVTTLESHGLRSETADYLRERAAAFAHRQTSLAV